MWHKILSLLAWVALLGYLIFAVHLCSREQEKRLVKEVVVTVRDADRLQIITPEMVKLWLEQEGFRLRDTEVERVDTEAIRRMIARRGFVRDVRVYTGLGGKVCIDLSQRLPIARVNTANGYNFYITEDGWILPLQRHYVLYVPTITGNFTPPFSREYIGSVSECLPEAQKKVDENYLFFTKLINFVRLIRGDSFWNAQIVQIDVSTPARGAGQVHWQEPEVEIVPRVGRHVVLLGTLDEVEQKLDRLMLFYRRVLDYEGWETYRTVNLKYRNQVVCTK